MSVLKLVLDRRGEAERHQVPAVGASVVRRWKLLEVLRRGAARPDAERINRRNLGGVQTVPAGGHRVRGTEPLSRPAGTRRRDRALIEQHAVAHRVRGDVAKDGRLAVFAKRFVVAEEEDLVPPDRSAERASESVLVELRRFARFVRQHLRELEEVLVARGRGAARQIVSRAVELVGPAPRHQRHLRTARAAGLGAVVARRHAELLQRLLRHPDR